jgi:hypothetical protein
MGHQSLRYEVDGAQHFSAAATQIVGSLAEVLEGLPTDRAGFRLWGMPALGQLLGADGPIGGLAASRIGPSARPVRAILFDKNEQANWALGWHQDRTIAVSEKIEVAGFGPWTVKQGVQHVAPPFELLAGMMTLRVHFDAVPVDNAPLLIAPGSHRFGRIAEAEIAEVVARCGAVSCEAEAGDIWCYATPILHASEAALRPVRRRVLQVDYAAAELPGGLQWLGV